MSIPAPEELTQKIARRAVEIAQFIGPRKTGKGLSSLYPIYQPGIIGIEIPDDVAYMFDLDQGIKAHAMMDLAGRVIPIRNGDGTISFRRASDKKIGTIPIVNRASTNGRIVSGKREWYYPDRPGLSFLQKSLVRSVDEWKRSTNAQEVIQMLLKSQEKNSISEIVYGRPAI